MFQFLVVTGEPNSFSRKAFGLPGDLPSCRLMLNTSVSVMLRISTSPRADERGHLAGALYVASPLAWGHGEVAYPYAFLGLFSALIAWLALDARVGRKDRTLVGAAALAVGGGFRPDLLPFLLPIWLWGTWPRGTRAILRGLVVILLGCIAWFVPMVVLSGGWGPYWEQSSAFSEAWAVPLSSPGAFGQGVRTNLRAFLDAAARTVTPLMAAAILYVCFATLALRRRWPPHAPWLLLLWLAVPLLAYVFVHLGKPGYLLTLLPAAVIVASAGIVVGAEDLAHLLRRPQRRE